MFFLQGFQKRKFCALLRRLMRAQAILLHWQLSVQQKRAV